jgi:hypothetical protein
LRALVHRPIEVAVSQEHREQDPNTPMTELIEQRPGVRLGTDRDITRHHVGAAYLRHRKRRPAQIPTGRQPCGY